MNKNKHVLYELFVPCHFRLSIVLEEKTNDKYNDIVIHLMKFTNRIRSK